MKTKITLRELMQRAAVEIIGPGGGATLAHLSENVVTWAKII
jgi:hypothetical protein